MIRIHGLNAMEKKIPSDICRVALNLECDYLRIFGTQCQY